MADELLETYIRQLLESQAGPEVIVGWQGGEPTLMGLDFFERSVAVRRAVQEARTAGLPTPSRPTARRSTDEWCAFFKKHKFLVGLSVDGPRELHDAYRVDKGGKGSFDNVMRGWRCLNRHGVDVNILCTVHAANADHPVEVYRFFRDELKTEFIQFIPIIERVTPADAAAREPGLGRARQRSAPLYRAGRQPGDGALGRLRSSGAAS